MIEYACPKCGASIIVPNSRRGKDEQCPNCGGQSQVPIISKAAAAAVMEKRAASAVRTPRKKSMPVAGLIATALVLGTILLAGLWIQRGCARIFQPLTEAERSAAAKGPPQDVSAETQARRRQLIADGQRLGLLGKVDVRGESVHVWVKPLFYSQAFDDKRNLLSAIWLLHFGQPRQLESRWLILRDELSGKRVGSYDPGLGLELK